MPANPADSALYRALFGDAETAQLFTDAAEVRAMMLVEGTLALVQAKLGVIPETAGKFLHRASFELQVDPAAMAAGLSNLRMNHAMKRRKIRQQTFLRFFLLNVARLIQSNKSAADVA